MTMGREGIEGHVAHDAEIRPGLFHRADRTANKVVRIQGLIPVLGLERSLDHRKDGDHRMPRSRARPASSTSEPIE